MCNFTKANAPSASVNFEVLLPLVNLLDLNLNALSNSLSTVNLLAGLAEQPSDTTSTRPRNLKGSLDFSLELVENCARLLNQLARVIEHSSVSSLQYLEKATGHCLQLLHELCLLQAGFMVNDVSRRSKADPTKPDTLALTLDYFNKTRENFQSFMGLERNFFHQEYTTQYRQPLH